MKKIALTKGKSCLVDDGDFKTLSNQKWYVNNRGYPAGWNKDTQQVCLMHRIIMKPPEGLVVDHINGDTLDNRRENLRVCTQKENANNRHGLSKRNTSGHEGVYWFKRVSKWTAGIRVGGKQKHLGYFTDLDDAIKARSDAVKMIAQGGI